MFKSRFSALHRAVISVALVAGATVALPAVADDVDAPQRVIKYSSADLASDTRVAALYEKLQRASRSVCSSLRGRDVLSSRNYDACYDKALADAVNEVNEQTLTALHNHPDAKAARAIARTRADQRS